MSRRHGIALSFYAITSILAFTAWTTSHSGTAALGIASFMAAIAFGFMWTHYLVDIIAPESDPEKSHDWIYKSSRIAVLGAIIAHPILINWYLITEKFGFPPEGYVALLGAAAWAIVLGWIALLIFLAFEIRNKLPRYRQMILRSNVIAMLLVLIHGFVAGIIFMNGWYWWVWILYLVSFVAAMLYKYDKEQTFRMPMIVIIVLLGLAGFVAALSNMPTSLVATNTPDTNSQTVTREQSSKDAPVDSGMSNVSQSELAAHDGKNGAECWVAVDGTIYDMSGSDEWTNGQHSTSSGQATCGRDLTQVIGESPHGKNVLSSMPVIGKLQ